MADPILKRICLHPYYAASPAQLTDVQSGVIGKLKRPPGRGDFCRSSDCTYRHSGFDINAGGMVNNGPFSALRAPFAGTVISCGKANSGNRYVTLQSSAPMEKWDGTSSRVRVKYVHLGICDQRISTGVGGSRGLSTPATTIGYPRANTPAPYYLTYAMSDPPVVYNYMWLNQMNRIANSQRSLSLGPSRLGDRFEHWFTETRGPDGFPLPTISANWLQGYGTLAANKLVIIDDDTSDKMAALLAEAVVGTGLEIVATRTLTSAGILKPVVKFGFRGVLGSSVGGLLMYEALIPATTDRYGPVLWPRSATEGAYMYYAYQKGQYIPRGFCVGFAGNTGTVATRRQGPTAGRHLHLQVYTETTSNKWSLVHPNTFKWRV